MIKLDFECIRQWLEIIESVATIFALIVGGIWACWLFILTRQKFPHANIRQEITHYLLPDDKYLVHVTLFIENIGDVLIQIQEIEVRLLEVLPLDPTFLKQIQTGEYASAENQPEFEWCQIQKKFKKYDDTDYEIEPSETDQYHFDFVAEKPIDVVQVYSHVKNISKEKVVGWSCTNFHEFMKVEEK